MARTRKKVAPVATGAAKKSGVSGELGKVLAEIDKEFGANTTCTGDEKRAFDRISTGSFILDFCLLGGIPVSAASMLIGDKHAGKTTVACKIIGNAQRMFPDKKVVLLDVEGTFDATWARALGVDTSELIVAHADTGEMAVDIVDAVAGSLETSLVVVDSLAMLIPTKEVEDSAEANQIGLQSRLINRMVRKLTNVFVRERKRDHMLSTLYLNQWRTKIGGFSPSGDPRTMPGGRAIEHHMSVMVTLKNKENKGRDSLGIETMTHNEHPFTINKNKMNSGPRSGEFMMLRTSGNEFGLPPGTVENATTMVAYAKKFGIYSGGGSSWTLEFNDYAVKVSNAQELVETLYSDDDLFHDLWVYLIQMQAHNVGQDAEFLARVPSFYP